MSQQYVLEGDQRRLVLPGDATQHSSARTEHYGLNFWKPSDKFVRSDFNADNLKVDAALWNIEKKPLLVPIGTTTLTEDAKQFTVDMSSIDWSAWEVVVAKMKLFGAVGRDGYVWVNNVRTGCNYRGLGSLNGETNTLARPKLLSPVTAGYTTLLFMSQKHLDNYVSTISYSGDRLGCGQASTRFQDFSYLTLGGDDDQSYKPGSTVELYGIQ